MRWSTSGRLTPAAATRISASPGPGCGTGTSLFVICLAEIWKTTPFISLLLALLLIPVEYADWFSALLKRLGDTLAPLALLSVGLQLRLGHIAEHIGRDAAGNVHRLFLVHDGLRVALTLTRDHERAELHHLGL